MKESIGKLISHVYPLLVVKEKGEINPYLEVRVEGGKYVLNSKFVNYSFGGLHSVFNKVLSKYNLSSRNVKKVLILGFGAGSVASLLRSKENISCPIIGVEGDKVVIKLTKKYFRPEQYFPLKIIHGDAFDYLMNTDELFDIIVVDVFIEDNVPEQFMTQDFVRKLNQVLSPKGILFYNKIINSVKHQKEAEKLNSLFSKNLGSVYVEKVNVNRKENWVYVFDRIRFNNNPNILRIYKLIPVRTFPSQTRPVLGT